MPVLALGKPRRVAHLVGGPLQRDRRRGSAWLVAFRLLRGRVDPRLLRLTVLVLLFASFLTNRLRDYNAEVLTATLVALGIVCVATDRHVCAGWAAIVVGVVNTPAAFVGLVLLAGSRRCGTRRLRHARTARGRGRR